MLITTEEFREAVMEAFGEECASSNILHLVSSRSVASLSPAIVFEKPAWQRDPETFERRKNDLVDQVH